MRVGVFDSGVGGLSVVKAIEQAMPEVKIIFRSDSKHVPYGDKDLAVVESYVVPILTSLVKDNCDAIVIACNTVTTTMINKLRKIISVPLVGIEPMVKPAAALTESKIIAVCATPNTLKSPRYTQLKEQYAAGVKILEPNCSQWSKMIEDNVVDHALIAEQIYAVLDQGADVIVLACTHYHWIDQKIQAMAQGRATVLQPEQAVIKQLTRVLARL